MLAFLWAAGITGVFALAAWIVVVASILPVLIDDDNLPDLAP